VVGSVLVRESVELTGVELVTTFEVAVEESEVMPVIIVTPV